MSVWYSIEGQVDVRTCPESNSIVAKIREKVSGMDNCAPEVEEKEGVDTLALYFGTEASHSWCCELEELLEGLALYAVSAGKFDVKRDDEPGSVYVGSTDQVDAFKKREREDDAAAALDDVPYDRLDDFLETYLKGRSLREKDWTVNLIGGGQAEDEGPTLYVVRAETREEAAARAKKCWAEGRHPEDPEPRVEGACEGRPPHNCGYAWNNRRDA